MTSSTNPGDLSLVPRRRRRRRGSRSAHLLSTGRTRIGHVKPARCRSRRPRLRAQGRGADAWPAAGLELAAGRGHVRRVDRGVGAAQATDGLLPGRPPTWTRSSAGKRPDRPGAWPTRVARGGQSGYPRTSRLVGFDNWEVHRGRQLGPPLTTVDMNLREPRGGRRARELLSGDRGTARARACGRLPCNPGTQGVEAAPVRSRGQPVQRLSRNRGGDPRPGLFVPGRGRRRRGRRPNRA